MTRETRNRLQYNQLQLLETEQLVKFKALVIHSILADITVALVRSGQYTILLR